MNSKNFSDVENPPLEAKQLSEVDVQWMQRAIQVADLAAPSGDVPIGAVVVSATGQELAIGWNTRERDQDPCGHAELNGLRAAAAQQGSWRLEGCSLYVTLEPCAMCAGAMVLARIQRCVWGAADPKGGYLGSLGNLGSDPRLNHRYEVQGGVLAEPCSAMLKAFFRDLRQKKG